MLGETLLGETWLTHYQVSYLRCLLVRTRAWRGS